MAKKRNDELMQSLALHVATGGRIRSWAKQHEVGERTAYTWSTSAEFKAIRDGHRKVIADRVLGRHFKLADRAMIRLAKLLDDETTSVRQRASEFVLTSLVSISGWAELRRELDEIKAQLARETGS